MATNSVITKVTGTDSSSNRIGSTFYGTCTDAATTAAKTVVLADSCVFNNSCLVTGVTIHVKFTNSNTYAKPALQVSNASPKPIMAHGTTYVGTTPETSWYAGAVVSFTYDGTYWVMNDYKIDTDTNTWRDVKLNGTQILGTSTSTGSLNIVPGTYMNITNSSGSVTFEPKETQVTQAQYDALVQAGTVDADTTYFITDRNNTATTYAAEIAYDNTESGLGATNVQSAIDEVASRNTYSTVEHVVGTWIDGKPIYEITIKIDNPSYSTTDYVDAMTINNVDICVSTSSIWYRTVSSNLLYYSAVGTICPEKGTVNYQIGTRFRKDTSKVQYLNVGYNQQMQTVWITAQYTKTTD